MELIWRVWKAERERGRGLVRGSWSPLVVEPSRAKAVLRRTEGWSTKSTRRTMTKKN